MRRVIAAFGICSLLVVLPTFTALAAEPPSAADDAALHKACLKLAADPFAGTGPREWSTPFQTIDAFQAIPVCREALRRQPDDARLKLATAFAYIAGRKNDEAKPLLDQLVAQNDSDAMLALAFISKGAEATELMRKAGEGGNASGLMLYGIAQRWDWQSTGNLASVMGSIKIASRGGQNHRIDRDIVAARYRQAFGELPW